MRKRTPFLLILLIVPLVLLMSGTALAVTESGYLNGPGASYTFTVNAGGNTLVEVPFTYPVGSVDFWVKVVGQDGSTVLGNFDLDNGEIIQLMGGGTFYLTIYSNRGSGYWSASYNLAGGGTTGGGTTTGSGDVVVNAGPDVETSGNTVYGYLNGSAWDGMWSFDVYKDFLEVTFSYPKGAVDFWVEVTGENGQVLGNFDLDNGEIIQLSGGGTFYMRIYSRSGSGNWSCTW
jgi:hypothetical protein